MTVTPNATFSTFAFRTSLQNGKIKPTKNFNNINIICYLQAS